MHVGPALRIAPGDVVKPESTWVAREHTRTIIEPDFSFELNSIYSLRSILHLAGRLVMIRSVGWSQQGFTIWKQDCMEASLYRSEA